MKSGQSIVEYGLIIVLVAIAVITIYALISDTNSVTGTVSKMWIQQNWDYITVKTTQGETQTYAINPLDYGDLSIGQTCTFQISPGGETIRSASCESPVK